MKDKEDSKKEIDRISFLLELKKELMEIILIKKRNGYLRRLEEVYKECLNLEEMANLIRPLPETLKTTLAKLESIYQKYFALKDVEFFYSDKIGLYY